MAKYHLTIGVTIDLPDSLPVDSERLDFDRVLNDIVNNDDHWVAIDRVVEDQRQ